MNETGTLPNLFTDLPEGLVGSLTARGSAANTFCSVGVSPPYKGVRQTKFRDGRLAAFRCLQQLGAEVESIGVGPRREPLWPDGFVGSISHSRLFSVAAVARLDSYRALGIDIEDDRTTEGIETYVLTPAEIAALRSLDDNSRRRAVISAFSAKEAVYKALYPRVRRFFGFHTLHVEPTEAGWVAEFTEPIDPALPPGSPIEVLSQWSGDLVCSWFALPEA